MSGKINKLLVFVLMGFVLFFAGFKLEKANNDIYIMDADGSNKTPLVYNNGYADISPAWSPDGTKIAYSIYQDWNWEIYVINADGTNPINVSKSKERDFAPAWSPDGTKIIYHSERDG